LSQNGGWISSFLEIIELGLDFSGQGTQDVRHRRVVN
jgi:hypothetical protein